jgi:hypothetical protein
MSSTVSHDAAEFIDPDFSRSRRLIPTTVRVVCQNTLNLALRESGVVLIQVASS